MRDPSSVSSLLASAPSELTIAYQALLFRDRQERQDLRKPQRESIILSPSKILPPLSSIGERLQVLNDWRREGFECTEEELEARSNSCLIDSNLDAYPFAFARACSDKALMQAQQWQSSSLLF